MDERCNFDIFKSNVCHRVKEIGDIEYIIEELENDNIKKYLKLKWYPECLYSLGMLDYLSRINNIPLCEEYKDLRKCRLEKEVMPAGVLALYEATLDKKIIEKVYADAIPEFRRFNIIESEVRNVV